MLKGENMSIQDKQRVYLIEQLMNENRELTNINIPKDINQQKLLLRALFNVREPKEISNQFKLIQDQYLQWENQQKGIITDFPDGISIWQGDITRIKIGAIVNAANSGMTGCYVPNHNCIDNAIHTFAGIELRNKCSEIMQEQGFPEPVGQAKITPAYNLPTDYVIHTVGPLIKDRVSPQDEEKLANSYHSCLSLAVKNGITSIAFPCISTGVFNFPNRLAAKIAVKTTKEFLQQNKQIKKVVFNVFKEKDKQIYEQLLRNN